MVVCSPESTRTHWLGTQPPTGYQPLHITCSLQVPRLFDDIPGFMIKALSHTYPVVLRGSLECPKLSFETTQALEKVHPQRGWEAAFPRRYHRRFFSQDWGYKHRQSSVSYRGDPGVEQDNDLLLEISSVGISLVVQLLTLHFQLRGNGLEQAGELRYIMPLGQKQNIKRCHQILPVSEHQTWGKRKRPKVDNPAQLPETKAHIPLKVSIRYRRLS